MDTPLCAMSTDQFKNLLKQMIREAMIEHCKDVGNRETLLNVQEAAALLNLAVNTLYEKTSERIIPHYKHGKKLLFKKSELLAWVETTRIKTMKQIREEAKTIVNKKHHLNF